MNYEKHDFDMAIHDYADHLVANYRSFADSQAHIDASKFQVNFVKGRKFLKVVTSSWGRRSVHSFICVQEHGAFKYGDILKAAGWSVPAKNFARGNALNTESYKNISWAGA
jgi:hypothetical protein